MGKENEGSRVAAKPTIVAPVNFLEDLEQEFEKLNQSTSKRHGSLAQKKLPKVHVSVKYFYMHVVAM